MTHLGDACTTYRSEARVHDTVFVGLDDDMNVLPVLLDDVVHRRRIPGVGFCRLLLGQVHTEGIGPGILPPCLFTGQL